MRKILITVLLASAAASPAIAGPRDWSDQQQARPEHSQSRSDRSAERQASEQARVSQRQQGERPQQFNGANRYPGQSAGGNRYQPQSYGGNVYQQRFDARRNGYAPQGYAPQGYAPQRYAPQGYAPQGNARANEMQRFNGRGQDMRYAPDYYRQSQRPNMMRGRNGPVVSDVPRPGTQPPMRYEGRRGGEVHWNTNWRNDGRYDWQEYRRHHRSSFHLGLYYDPFGWGYQPFSIGYRLWPAYYGNQYWIDPGMYELPYPPPGAVWVRYWNDALLVDMYSGTVIDVIPGFFW